MLGNFCVFFNWNHLEIAAKMSILTLDFSQLKRVSLGQDGKVRVELSKFWRGCCVHLYQWFFRALSFSSWRLVIARMWSYLGLSSVIFSAITLSHSPSNHAPNQQSWLLFVAFLVTQGYSASVVHLIARRKFYSPIRSFALDRSEEGELLQFKAESDSVRLLFV